MMIKTRMLFGIGVWAAAAAGAGEWRVTRDIAGQTETTAVVSVTLDAHVFENSQPQLADVRVLDCAGREVPHVILPERDYVFEQRYTPRGATLKSLEQLPEGGLAVVCEIGRTNAVSLSQATLQTPLRNYEQTVTVYIQDGKGGWQPVKGAEPLFDYSRFADVKKETVDLPLLTNRLFRLVIGQADDTSFSAYTSVAEESDGGQKVQRQFRRYHVERRPFRIDSVTFRDTERVAVAKQKQERVAVLNPEVKEETDRKTTTLTFPAGRYPVVGVALVPEQQNFERKVTVDCPGSGGWRVLANGVLSRSRLPGMTPSDHFEVGFNETRTEQLRVQIRNDDNPPLTFGKGGVTLVRQVYSAVFIAEKGERYRFVYGNPEVQAPPVYEQGVVAYLNRGQKTLTWKMSPAPEGAVTYGATVCVRQFLVKHGMLLLSVLVMAALGLLILRAVRHVEK